MATSSDPVAELRRVNKRLDELQKRMAELRRQQRELVAQVGLSHDEEKVVIGALTLANEVLTLLEQLEEAEPSDTQRRRGVQFLRRLDRCSKQLEKLPESDGRGAANLAVADAVQRLFNALFRV